MEGRAKGRYAIDVSRVKTAIIEHRDLGELISAIRGYEAAQSTLADLREANLAIDTIAETQLDQPLRQKFGAALMTHAVVTYCRATHSKADARWKIGITKRFSSDQMQKHRKITDLRDTVFAHFGFPAEEHGARWLEERVVTKYVDGAETNSFVWRRANFLGTAVTDLKELITVAIETGKQITEERGAAMSLSFVKYIDDKRVISAVQSSPFDPYTFWGPSEAADTFWEFKDGKKSESFKFPA